MARCKRERHKSKAKTLHVKGWRMQKSRNGRNGVTRQKNSGRNWDNNTEFFVACLIANPHRPKRLNSTVELSRVGRCELAVREKTYRWSSVQSSFWRAVIRCDGLARWRRFCWAPACTGTWRHEGRMPPVTSTVCALYTTKSSHSRTNRINRLTHLHNRYIKVNYN